MLVRSASIYALSGRSKPPERLIRSLATMLCQEKGLERTTLLVLSKLSNCPDDLSSEVILRKDSQKDDLLLGHPKLFNEWCNKSILSKEALEVLVRYLVSSVSSVRCSVIEILDGQPNLSEAILQEIVMHLKDDNDQVRTAAIDALSHRPYLSETIVNRIVAILDERNSTKQAALQALKHLSNLPKTVLDKIADCIKNRDPLIKTAAIKGRGGRSYLSDSPDILNKIATHIYHADAGGEVGVTAGVIAAAIQAFSIGDPSILKDWLEVIALRINDGDKEVRNAVVQVLIRQSDLSKEHLSLLAARINDEDEKVRLGAVKFLEKQETLTDETLRIMASQISDSEITRLADPMEVHFLVNLLNQREMLHSELLLRGLAHRFLLPLLLRSFKTHLAWYFRDGESYLETNNATKSRGRCDEVDIEVEMESAREEAGMPPVAVLYS